MLIQRFEEQVEKSLNKIAIKTEEDNITYQQLNNYANSLANMIIENNLEKEEQSVIGIIFGYEIDAIIAMLSVLKAADIYVPIDNTYPEELILNMIEDSNISTIITNMKNIHLVERVVYKLKKDIIVINTEDVKNKEVYENPHPNIFNEQELAYLLYTSGSTGKRKAIMQTQKNVLHYVEQYIVSVNITSNDNLTLFSSISHDAAVIDIYSGLLTGATLFMLDIKKHENLPKLSAWLNKQKITIWHSVPTLYRHFIKYIKETDEFPYLKYIVLGGEAVIKNDLDSFQKLFKNTLLFNLYGQSESSFNSGQFFNTTDDINRIPIGKSIEGIELLLVDEEGYSVDAFEIGEIVVAGEYVSLGYWNNKELTERVFKTHGSYKRIYKTGDLGKLNLDGSIEYIGRKDFQVKIRGFRVEIGEIESNLLEHHDIEEVVVLSKASDDGEIKLFAYYTSKDRIKASSLRSYLLEKLPDYMVPAHFIQIEKIPLTTSGKTDRKELIRLEVEIASGEEFEAPRNEIEEKLVSIWEKILKVKKISINDVFLNLGGNSINLIELATEIYKEFNVKLTVMDLFNNTRIKDLSELITNNVKSLNEESVILLNDEKEKKLFCFPPIIGYGVVYRSLDSLMDKYALYAFNYIENENKINKYADIITDIQKSGQIVLLGYSAGGGLAFEVAKELENRGRIVSNIILLDSFKNEGSKENQVKEEEEKEEMIYRLKDSIIFRAFKDDILAKHMQYYKFYINTRNTGTVNANIHLVKATDASEKITLWKNSTKKDFLTYDGFGTHRSMLDDEFKDKNSELVYNILLSCY